MSSDFYEKTMSFTKSKCLVKISKEKAWWQELDQALVQRGRIHYPSKIDKDSVVTLSEVQDNVVIWVHKEGEVDPVPYGTILKSMLTEKGALTLKLNTLRETKSYYLKQLASTEEKILETETKLKELKNVN